MSDCKFCQLLARADLGSALPNLVHETLAIVALLNRRPLGPDHVTLVLKAHHAHTSNCRDAHFAGLGDLVGRLSVALETLHAPARVVFLGDGKPSAHLHFHLIPESPGQRLELGAAVADLNLAARPSTLSDADTAAAVSRLRQALSS